MGEVPRSNAAERTTRARALPLVLGLGLLTTLVGFDIATGESTVIVSTVLLAPFITARVGSERQTVIVAAATVLCAVASERWTPHGFDSSYYVRLFVIMAGAIIAIVAARERVANERAIRRFSVLTAVADVTNGRRSLVEVLDRIGDIIVPEVADQWACDLKVGDGFQRVRVRASGPDRSRSELRLAEAGACVDDPPAGWARLRQERESELLERADLARGNDGWDPDRWWPAGAQSVTIVPLCARGDLVGTISLAVGSESGRRFRADDLNFHEVLSGRIALAIDNAGLDTDLREAERQLATALGQLDEAVIIATAAGAVSYLNDAAVTLLDLHDRSEVGTDSLARLLDRLAYFDAQTGRHLDRTELPWGGGALTALDGETVVVRSVAVQSAESRWLQIRTSAFPGRDGEPSQVVIVMEDITALKTDEQSAQVRAEVAAVLAATSDAETALQRVADALVPGLTRGCVVAVLERSGELRVAAAMHQDPLQAERLVAAASDEEDPFGLGRVISDAQPAVSVYDWDTPVATIPLLRGDEVFGALVLVGSPTGSRFTRPEMMLASDIARKVAVAIQGFRLAAEIESTNAALQGGLRPAVLPLIRGWSLVSHYQPAGAGSQVGGDFYDVFETPGGWVAVMGDVTGHGPGAARLTAVSRFALRAVAELTGDVLTAIQQLNRMLIAEPELSLVTVTCVTLWRDPSTRQGTVSVVRCGHPAPLLVTGQDVRPLGAIGPMLGAIEDALWRPESFPLSAGDTVLLYTDGVTDVSGAADRFGDDRLHAALEQADRSPPELVAAVVRALDEFRVGGQRDDEALLALGLVSA